MQLLQMVRHKGFTHKSWCEGKPKNDHLFWNKQLGENDSYFVDKVETGELLAGIHHLYCTDAEEVESDTHLAVAYQKVLQKD